MNRYNHGWYAFHWLLSSPFVSVSVEVVSMDSFHHLLLSSLFQLTIKCITSCSIVRRFSLFLSLSLSSSVHIVQPSSTNSPPNKPSNVINAVRSRFTLYIQYQYISSSNPDNLNRELNGLQWTKFNQRVLLVVNQVVLEPQVMEKVYKKTSYK